MAAAFTEKVKKKLKIKFWGWLMAALARGKLMPSWLSKANPGSLSGCREHISLLAEQKGKRLHDKMKAFSQINYFSTTVV